MSQFLYFYFLLNLILPDFCLNHFTITTLFRITDDHNNSKSSGYFSVLILLDNQLHLTNMKEHFLLLSFRTLLSWLFSYLTYHCFSVYFLSWPHFPQLLNTGVPLGSVLGCLFHIYTLATQTAVCGTSSINISGELVVKTRCQASLQTF